MLEQNTINKLLRRAKKFVKISVLGCGALVFLLSYHPYFVFGWIVLAGIVFAIFLSSYFLVRLLLTSKIDEVKRKSIFGTFRILTINILVQFFYLWMAFEAGSGYSSCF